MPAMRTRPFVGASHRAEWTGIGEFEYVPVDQPIIDEAFGSRAGVNAVIQATLLQLT